MALAYSPIFPFSVNPPPKWRVVFDTLALRSRK